MTPIIKQNSETDPTAIKHCNVQFQGSASLDMQSSSEQSAGKQVCCEIGHLLKFGNRNSPTFMKKMKNVKKKQAKET